MWWIIPAIIACFVLPELIIRFAFWFSKRLEERSEL